MEELMASKIAMVPFAVCEECWLSTHSRWEPESMDSTGNILMKLIGIEVPKKTNTGSVEVCCVCGSVTIAGIFEMKDPETVNFTKEEKANEYEYDLTHSFLDFDDDFGDEKDI
jgi:hypothetical protein